MKKILLTILIVLMTACFAQAGFKVDVPNESGVTAFYFPVDGNVAGGLTYTGLRLSHTAVPIASLDLDGTLAQKIGNDSDTLAGLGVKVNLYLMQNKPGWNFLPNIGYTFLSNMKNLSMPKDFFSNMKGAIYGTIVMYKFTNIPIIE